MPIFRSCLRCGALSDKSYCRRHRHLQGGTGQRGSTWRWRKLRRAVLERDRWRCTEILGGDASRYRCRETTGLEVHHIVSVRDGGLDELSNLRTVCPAHHPRT
jgi:5-methylcytosine-specific restriction endonuclease McrA